MRIKLTCDIFGGAEDGCVKGKEFDAVLVGPRSTTVEIVGDSGRPHRAFHYEYEMVTEEQAAKAN
ncbi:hypothetical protein [Thalassomonas haliotis]|uniref:Uncharacterized protein n=1 Tax=Thalassomonas haliotis TaxID=485448 RepID=A0ABY7VKZ0_9GAMM|nr:hypothetical protein [Thalassomonas haliotis]WDE14148.1 hypothetical protein H3N35_12465 [Thalassomonas haliotis]